MNASDYLKTNSYNWRTKLNKMLSGAYFFTKDTPIKESDFKPGQTVYIYKYEGDTEPKSICSAKVYNAVGEYSAPSEAKRYSLDTGSKSNCSDKLIDNNGNPIYRLELYSSSGVNYPGQTRPTLESLPPDIILVKGASLTERYLNFNSDSYYNDRRARTNTWTPIHQTSRMGGKYRSIRQKRARAQKRRRTTQKRRTTQRRRRTQRTQRTQRRTKRRI